MRGTARELLSATVLLVLAYLVLTHWAGFAADLRAAGAAYSGSVKVLQGR